MVKNRPFLTFSAANHKDLLDTKKALFLKEKQGFSIVGVIGFEPTTLWSQTRCASQTALHPDCVLQSQPVLPLDGYIEQISDFDESTAANPFTDSLRFFYLTSHIFARPIFMPDFEPDYFRQRIPLSVVFY